MLTDSPGLPLPDQWGMRYSYVYEPDHPELPRAVFAVCAEGDWQLEMPIDSSVADDNAILHDHHRSHSKGLTDRL